MKTTPRHATMDSFVILEIIPRSAIIIIHFIITLVVDKYVGAVSSSNWYDIKCLTVFTPTLNVVHGTRSFTWFLCCKL